MTENTTVDTRQMYLEYRQNALQTMNAHVIPEIEKITIHSGIKSLVGKDTNNLTLIKQDYESIFNQKAYVVKSKKNIAAFSVRINDIVGIYVTLRKASMYNFLNKFLYLASPRIRNFTGFNLKNFDKHGNISIGIQDLDIFYEINPSIRKVLHYGCCITITVRNNNNISEIENMLKNMYFTFPDEL